MGPFLQTFVKEYCKTFTNGVFIGLGSFIINIWILPLTQSWNNKYPKLSKVSSLVFNAKFRRFTFKRVSYTYWVMKRSLFGFLHSYNGLPQSVVNAKSKKSFQEKLQTTLLKHAERCSRMGIALNKMETASAVKA